LCCFVWFCDEVQNGECINRGKVAHVGGTSRVLRIPEQYSAGSAWRGNRRMTCLRRHPAAYCADSAHPLSCQGDYSNKF
ncbi:hypothetical protein EPW68_20905, partial [Salmonella enterica]|nr:hypothetical protein [Salmonella enterica]